MAKPFSLQPLLDLAQDRTDAAARRLGELIAAEREDARKLEMLESYRAEYQNRFTEAARDGIGPDAWRNFSAFIARLDEAIASQRNSLDRSQGHTADGQDAWRAQHSKLKAFDTLSKRHVNLELKQQSRLEQRASDEYSAKPHNTRGGWNS